MSGKRTIKEIVEYLRKCPTNTIADCLVKLVADNLADKLEDALRIEESKHREEVKSLQATIKKLNDALTEQNGKLGNVAAMREALLRCNAIAQLPECRNLQAIKDMRGIIRAALSAPPRNCDVGTAEEQTQRHIDHCRVHVCKECKYRWLRGSCSLAWAQAPYEKEVAK